MNDETLSKLERLANLRQQGAITSEEFEQQKAALLGNSTPVLPIQQPPPIEPAAPVPTYNPLYDVEPVNNEEEPPKSNFWKWVLGGIAFMVVLALILPNQKKPEETTTDIVDSSSTYGPDTEIGREMAAAAAEEAAPKASRDLVISKTSWEKGGFGSVGLHSFSIKNTSKVHTYKDIPVRFTYYGSSNTEISSVDQIVYRTIAPGKTIRIRGLNTGFINQQATSASVQIGE